MGYSSSDAKKFISEIAPIIQREAKARGYLVCSPVIAQAICESGANTSSLSKKYHNYFGLKCGTAWKGKSVNLSTKEEYSVGTLTTIKDNFRVYDSMEDGVKGYFDFISTKRYANLKTASTPLEYLARIKQDGYATSSTYVNTNISIVNKYNLAEWDNSTPKVETSVETPKTTYKIGQTYTLNANMFVRVQPSGEKVLFSQLSKNAKQHAYDDGSGYGILRKGTRVTCQGISNKGNDIWVKIPSGYVAGLYNGKRYIE